MCFVIIYRKWIKSSYNGRGEWIGGVVCVFFSRFVSKLSNKLHWNCRVNLFSVLQEPVTSWYLQTLKQFHRFLFIWSPLTFVCAYVYRSALPDSSLVRPHQEPNNFSSIEHLSSMRQSSSLHLLICVSSHLSCQRHCIMDQSMFIRSSQDNHRVPYSTGKGSTISCTVWKLSIIYAMLCYR
jgi:hypothetical protein